MPILLIIISFLLSCLILWLREAETNCGLRVAILKAFIVQGVLISIVTEGLSLIQSLTSSSVALFWLFVDLVSLVMVLFLFQYRQGTRHIKQRVHHILSSFQAVDGLSRFSLTVVFIVLLVTLATALIAPPNNWDSMTYHMPRVMHWIQNQSVQQYPTNNLRQISFPPGAAYIITQFQLLAGSDRFAICVQWLALLGSIMGISLLTRNLVGSQYQWISALVCISIPMAIMQAMTTQTDLTTAFWLVSFTFFVFRSEEYSRQDLFWIAASLGLAILTKPTAFIFGLSPSMYFVFRLFKKLPFRKLITAMVSFSLITFSFSLPSFWRNYNMFSHFLGIDLGTRATEFGLSPFISTFLKTLLINFPLSIFRNFISFVHTHMLGLRIDDLRFNFDGVNIMEEPLLKFLAPHEDFVGSPIHILLFAIGVYIIFIKYRKNLMKGKRNISEKQGFDIFILAVSILVSFILFCTLLKWQKYHNRLLLPLIVFSTPIITYSIKNIISLHMRRAVIMVLALGAVSYALTPIRHPLISLPIISDKQLREQSRSVLQLDREDIYFSGVMKELKVPYHAAVDAINQHHCQSIGILLGEADWEYPLWVLLKSKLQQPFQLKHINIRNVSKRLTPEFPEAQLCAVVTSKNINNVEILESKPPWQKLLVLSMELSEPHKYLTVYGR